jgi:hypothetical protein
MSLGIIDFLLLPFASLSSMYFLVMKPAVCMKLTTGSQVRTTNRVRG